MLISRSNKKLNIGPRVKTTIVVASRSSRETASPSSNPAPSNSARRAVAASWIPRLAGVIERSLVSPRMVAMERAMGMLTGIENALKQK